MEDSFDKKHGMNTINTNGRAYNGAIGPVVVAMLAIVAVALLVAVTVIGGHLA